MENAAKALEMAAGVLLGVILMALVVYFFSNISSWPQNEDDIMSRDQLYKFNQEYLVYEKTQMYGVDVISCLNKVISNNEKYAQGGAFLGGNASLADYKQRENFWINVRLKLKSGGNLEEEVIVYQCDANNRESLAFGGTGVYINNPGLKKLAEAITKVGPSYTKLKTTDELKPTTNTVQVFNTGAWYNATTGYINLIVPDGYGNVSDMNPDLISILKSIQTLGGNQGSSNLSFTIKNTTKTDYRKWTTVTWNTVLYDLKNRKFKCTGTSFNDATGRVNEMVFEEL